MTAAAARALAGQALVTLELAGELKGFDSVVSKESK